jgi:hypothetical protein
MIGFNEKMFLWKKELERTTDEMKNERVNTVVRCRLTKIEKAREVRKPMPVGYGQ